MRASTAMAPLTVLNLPFNNPRLLPLAPEMPGFPLQSASDSDIEFQSACLERDLTFNPRELGFLPTVWPDRQATFGELVHNFFRRKSGTQTRFLHKLFNAIRISDTDCSYFNLVGVQWVTDRIIKVDKNKFARLLGIKSVDGALFHKQGNFPSHGFTEVTPTEAQRLVPHEELEDVDFENVRLFVHEGGAFLKGCGSEIERECRWVNIRRIRNAETEII
jgi:hypothetical protein